MARAGRPVATRAGAAEPRGAGLRAGRPGPRGGARRGESRRPAGARPRPTLPCTTWASWPNSGATRCARPSSWRRPSPSLGRRAVHWGQGNALASLGRLALARGAPAKASAFLAEALVVRRAIAEHARPRRLPGRGGAGGRHSGTVDERRPAGGCGGGVARGRRPPGLAWGGAFRAIPGHRPRTNR